LLNFPNTWKSFFFSRFFFALEPILFGADPTHVACIKARRSEVCPDIEEERAEFCDADLVYKRLKRKQTSDILAMGQYRSKGGFSSHDLSLAHQKKVLEEKQIEVAKLPVRFGRPAWA
jgi:hypothetical protein